MIRQTQRTLTSCTIGLFRFIIQSTKWSPKFFITLINSFWEIKFANFNKCKVLVRSPCGQKKNSPHNPSYYKPDDWNHRIDKEKLIQNHEQVIFWSNFNKRSFNTIHQFNVLLNLKVSTCRIMLSWICLIHHQISE